MPLPAQEDLCKNKPMLSVLIFIAKHGSGVLFRSYGNRVDMLPDQHFDVRVEGGPAGVVPVVPAASETGMLAVSYTAKAAGTYIVSARYNNVHLARSPCTVVASTAEACAGLCEVRGRTPGALAKRRNEKRTKRKRPHRRILYYQLAARVPFGALHIASLGLAGCCLTRRMHACDQRKSLALVVATLGSNVCWRVYKTKRRLCEPVKSLPSETSQSIFRLELRSDG